MSLILVLITDPFQRKESLGSSDKRCGSLLGAEDYTQTG
jgi:hypothetical protein